MSFLLGMAVQQNARRAAAAKGELKVAMVPKFDGLLPFEQAKAVAYAAHRELGSRGRLKYVVPPVAEGSGAKQIDIVQSTIQTGFDAILLSNNANDDIAEAAIPTTEAGLDIITFDSPIPSGIEGGEQLFVSQVNFAELGQTMAEMALQILPNRVNLILDPCNFLRYRAIFGLTNPTNLFINIILNYYILIINALIYLKNFSILCFTQTFCTNHISHQPYFSRLFRA